MSSLRFSVLSLTRSAASVRRPCWTPRFYSSAASSSSTTTPLIIATDLPAPGSGHIRVLEINRPDARNAISRALLTALRTEIDAVAQQYDDKGNETAPDGNNTRALIIASALDSCFCSGADLKERRTFTPDETAVFLSNLRGTFTALQALPVPTISAISSVALGGGLELALSTHMRVLTSNAVVGLPETRLGIIPGAGGTYRLPMLIGVGRARDMIITGRRVAAPEAYFLGIADRLVQVDTAIEESKDDKESKEDKDKKYAAVMETARRAALSESVRLAQEICSGGPVAVRAALQAVQYPAEVVENSMYERVVATEDRNEALKAFAEKRRPEFKGR